MRRSLSKRTGAARLRGRGSLPQQTGLGVCLVMAVVFPLAFFRQARSLLMAGATLSFTMMAPTASLP